MDIVGASHPFFKPLLRRYVIVATSLIWTIIEWMYGDPFWGILSSGMFALCAHDLLWAYERNHGSKATPEGKKPDGKP